MITKKELEHLKELSKVDIENNEEFLKKLWPVIEYLNRIKEIDTDGIDYQTWDKSLNIEKKQEDFWKQDKILDNVKHKKINNSIVIKSPIK